MNDKIIAKIQKLLALANSSEMHEAEAAARLAQELLVRHNLDLQTVKDIKLDYTETVANEEPYLRWHQPFVHHILQDYFFIRVIYTSSPTGYTIDGRRKFKKVVSFYGTTTNVQIALYVNDFLSRIFQELWLKYKKDTGYGEKSRKSYYKGLRIGLANKLEMSREKIQQERGLILIEDPELLKKTMDMRGYKNPHRGERNLHAEATGVKDGIKINISKGLNEDARNSGLMLNERKK